MPPCPYLITAKFMKSNLLIPAMFLVATVLLVIFGSGFIESWKSFLIGVLFTLSIRDVGKELWRRVARR